MNKTAKFWDKLSSRFDKQVLKSFGQYYAMAIERMREHLHRSNVVLDFACGTGIITNEIADDVKKVHAIDISAKMLDVAREKANDRNLENVEFAQSTIFDEKHERESFDVVVAFNILHLLEDTQQVMQRMHELLKPGGLLISFTECMGEQRTFSTFFLSLLSKTRIIPYLKFFKMTQLQDATTHASFQIVATEKLNNSQFIVAKKI